MYYRRKIILGILEEFGGTLSSTKLQKVLFLVTRKQEKKAFDFVPYKFGCYSFQANQDLSTLEKYGLVKSSNSKKGSDWGIKSDVCFLKELKKEDQSAIYTVKREINHLSQKELIRYTYIRYPFYASKSQIANQILSTEEIATVEKQKRKFDNPEFFTIGYEGISLETYLNKLIINDVRLLCDVRKNPLSMKYGFSKSQLRNACESIGIRYEHISELGIESDKRQELNSMADYSLLFEEYEKTTLKQNESSLLHLLGLINQYNRVAITCFEKDVCMCHRGRVLKALTSRKDWTLPYKNL